MRRRLAGVAEVSISQSQQTAAVTFVPGTRAFSAAAFRDAVAEADVDVVSLEVDVCGIVDEQNVLRSSTLGPEPFIRLRGGGAAVGNAVCVTGRLDDRHELPEVEVTKLLP
ncbi:MAG: hypothetical protein ABI024_15980 [Vicinamibacterales bacterium]